MSLTHKFVVAALGGGAVLITVAPPAEHGVDATSLGARLGLTASAEEQVPARSCDPAFEFDIGDYDPTADRIDESVRGLIHLEESRFRRETIDIEIEDFGEVEHKFVMAADATFIYSWEVLRAVDGGVYYDFHGHPSSADAADYPDGFEMAYARGEGAAQHGSFTAPFPGYHGFYFMNIEEGPITVRLTISGYWDDHKEMYRAVRGEVLRNEDF